MYQRALGGWPAMIMTQDACLAAAQATKLANVLFAYELQRRLGVQGVRSCAVDPGSVATNIYAGSALFSRQPLRWLIKTFYAPPADGAAAVVHAACAPWERPAQQQHGGAGSLAAHTADGMVNSWCLSAVNSALIEAQRVRGVCRAEDVEALGLPAAR